MPIIRAIGVLLLALAVLPMAALSAPVEPPKAVRFIIREPKQLVERSPELRNFQRPYQLLVTAYTIQTLCEKELKITETQKAFIQTSYKKLSAAYFKAFDDAFVAYTGAPSPKEMTERYIEYMQAQQQQAADRAALSVRTQYCSHPQIKDVIKYYDQLQKLEEVNAPPADESAPAQQQPEHVN